MQTSSQTNSVIWLRNLMVEGQNSTILRSQIIYTQKAKFRQHECMWNQTKSCFTLKWSYRDLYSTHNNLGMYQLGTMVCKPFVSKQSLKIWRCPIRIEVMSFVIVLIGQCWITTALLLTRDLQTTVLSLQFGMGTILGLDYRTGFTSYKTAFKSTWIHHYNHPNNKLNPIT